MLIIFLIIVYNKRSNYNNFTSFYMFRTKHSTLNSKCAKH